MSKIVDKTIHFGHEVLRFISWLLILPIRFYQQFISPL